MKSSNCGALKDMLSGSTLLGIQRTVFLGLGLGFNPIFIICYIYLLIEIDDCISRN